MLAHVRAAIALVRPAQWVKNIFVFGALVFGPRRGDEHAILLSIAGFIIFCLLSGAVYAFNDMRDYRDDALHPSKKKRPVASGALSPLTAGLIAIFLAAFAMAASTKLPGGFAVTAGSYLALNIVYSLWAKHRVLLDVIFIAIGFVMRALAGAQAIEVEVSAWLVVCTFTLCLFLGFGKRRCELAVLGIGGAAAHRRTLAAYTPDLLTQLLSVTGGGAVITFLLYTLDPHTPSPRSMIFTTPLVFYAIFRYATVIGLGELTGPTDVLIRDRPFLATAILWCVVTLCLVSYGPSIERYLPKLRYPGMPVTTQSTDSPT